MMDHTSSREREAAFDLGYARMERDVLPLLILNGSCCVTLAEDTADNINDTWDPSNSTHPTSVKSSHGAVSCSSFACKGCAGESQRVGCERLQAAPAWVWNGHVSGR